MRRWRQARRLPWVLMLACMAVAGLTGCSRQLAVPRSTGTTGSGQLPFDRVSDGNGVSPTEAFAFEGLPAGTEITVRLRSALSSANSRAGDSFDAVLDDSIVIAGKTFAPRGASVAGNLVDTKASAGHDPGYLRMTLASIVMNGRSIPVQTSSIFTKGDSFEKRAAANMNAPQAGRKDTAPEALAGQGVGAAPSTAPTSSDVRFSTGHRFTFRLTQPLHL